MATEKVIDDLITRFARLPTLGRKSAQKIVFELLSDENKISLLHLLQALKVAGETIHNCKICNTLTEHEICKICSDTNRDHSKAMIVSSPLDIEHIEEFGLYDGIYFVLKGLVNPILGISIESIGLNKFVSYLRNQNTKEVIIALSTSIEGEATAQTIAEICHKLQIPCYKFATGLPSGVSFSNVDTNTVLSSFLNRTKV